MLKNRIFHPQHCRKTKVNTQVWASRTRTFREIEKFATFGGFRCSLWQIANAPKYVRIPRRLFSVVEKSDHCVGRCFTTAELRRWWRSSRRTRIPKGSHVTEGRSRRKEAKMICVLTMFVFRFGNFGFERENCRRRNKRNANHATCDSEEFIVFSNHRNRLNNSKYETF